jgi:hypothetical protein
VTLFFAYLLAFLMLACCLWTSYLVALWLLGPVSTSVRWCAAAVVAYFLLAALFYLLALPGLFCLELAAPLWLAVALSARWLLDRGRVAGQVLQRDLRRLAELVRGLAVAPGSPLRWLAAAGALVVGLRTARGLVAPPLAWDALIYHLLRAGRWVQTGSLEPHLAPDAWRYFEFYPVTGDALWAWAMLPLHGDALLAPAGLLVWLSLLLGGYGAARTLGARERDAVLAALLTGLTPACVNYLTSASVNNTLLALFLLGVVFLGRLLRQPRPARALLLGGALGVGAGVQLYGAPLLLLAGGVVLVLALTRGRGSPRWRIVGAFALAAAVAAPGYLRTWIATGSPLYPFSLSLAGRTLLPGNDDLMAIMRDPGPTPFHPLEFVYRLFFIRLNDTWEHLNLGPGSALVVLLGLAGAARLLRRRGQRVLVGFLLATVLVLLAATFSDALLGQRTKWASVVGRFLLPGLAALVLTSSTLGWWPALAAALLANLLLTLPLGWTWADLEGLMRLALPLLLGGALALESLLWLRRRRRALLGLAAACCVLAAVGALWLEPVREDRRPSIYSAAAGGTVEGREGAVSFDVHALKPEFAAAHEIWTLLDGGPGHRVAYAAGREGLGQGLYLYPLLGSRLQNRLLYVPPTADGSVPPTYAMSAAEVGRLDPRAWLRRLRQKRVDHVVLLPPEPPELSWILKRPGLFTPLTGTDPERPLAFRVDWRRAKRRRLR